MKIVLPFVVGIIMGSILTSNIASARHERGHGLNFPESIAIDSSNGNVFVGIDAGGLDMIQKFTNNGKLIRQWDTPSAHDIAVDKSGNVFVVGGSDNIPVIKYTNTGKFIKQWDEFTDLNPFK